MDNGSFCSIRTCSRQAWRLSQLSPNMAREFSCYFLDDCHDLGCYAEQLRSLFVVVLEPCSPGPVGLGRNWYFLLQPHTKSSAKPWYDGAKCHHQQLHPPHQCPLVHFHHMLTYYHIPPPHKCKWCRGVLLPALSISLVYVEAINGPSESTKEQSPTPLLLAGPSESMDGQRPISSLRLVKSAGDPHVKATVGAF